MRRIYGKSLMGEVVEQTLNETSQKVLDDNQLRVASQPDLKPESDMEKVIAGQADLAYELDVEVMPDFEPVDPADAEAGAAGASSRATKEVDEALAELAEQNRTYETRNRQVGEGQGRRPGGDRLRRPHRRRALRGRHGRRRAPGAGRRPVHPGLRGAADRRQAPGDELTVKVTFPDDYQVERLSGKAGRVRRRRSRKCRPRSTRPIDDDFAKRLGMADLEALKDGAEGPARERIRQRLPLSS